jgi:hypothetical protein
VSPRAPALGSPARKKSERTATQAAPTPFLSGRFAEQLLDHPGRPDDAVPADLRRAIRVEASR